MQYAVSINIRNDNDILLHSVIYDGFHGMSYSFNTGSIVVAEVPSCSGEYVCFC